MLYLKQATSHKPQAFKLGFTLSELLGSLAVLGLIAGLTVPSIVASVENSKRRAPPLLRLKVVLYFCICLIDGTIIKCSGQKPIR